MHSKSFAYYIPIVAFGSLWTIIFLLYTMNPYNFHRVSADTALLMVVGIGSIILGYFFTHAFLMPDTLGSSNQESKHIAQYDNSQLTRVILISNSLAIIGTIISVLAVVQYLGGLQIYATNPLLVRQATVQISKVGSIAEFPIYTIGNYLINFVFIGALYSGAFWSNKYNALLKSLPLITAFFISAFLLQRMIIITALGIWTFSYLFSLYTHPKAIRLKQIRSLKIVTLSMVVLFMLFSYFIVRARMFYLNNILDFFIKSVYAYAVGTVSALDIYLRQDISYTWGESSFRTVFKWLSRLGIYVSTKGFSPFQSFADIGGIKINTYTFIRTLYTDFGMIGLGILGFTWGSLSRFSVQKLFQQFSFIRLFIVVLLSFSLFMSFYEFYFQGLTKIIYWIILLLLTEKIFSTHSTSKSRFRKVLPAYDEP